MAESTGPAAVSLPVTEADKAKAFEHLAMALTNRWYDGEWSWWCCSPCGGGRCKTQAEAIAELVRWAEKIAKKNRQKFNKLVMVKQEEGEQ